MSTILLPPSNQSPAPGSLRASDIQVVAFSVVGLAMAIFALPDVARFFIDSAWWNLLSRGGTPREQRLLHELPQIMSLAVRFIFGLALFFHSRRFAAWWARKQRWESTKRHDFAT